jgi:hypothetical protein
MFVCWRDRILDMDGRVPERREIKWRIASEKLTSD